MKPWHLVKSPLVGGTPPYVCKCQDDNHEKKVAASDVVELSTFFYDLANKVQYFIDVMDAQGYLPEHYFTFPDGDTMWATGFGPGEG